MTAQSRTEKQYKIQPMTTACHSDLWHWKHAFVELSDNIFSLQPTANNQQHNDGAKSETA
eukprot:98406-Amphidinium_carterae.1